MKPYLSRLWRTGEVSRMPKLNWRLSKSRRRIRFQWRIRWRGLIRRGRKLWYIFAMMLFINKEWWRRNIINKNWREKDGNDSL